MEFNSSFSGEETTPTTRSASCFPCCFTYHRSTADDLPWWERVRNTSLSRGFMKIREWSEIVAGPRWKTFIRRFNRNKTGAGGYRHAGKYQYDPLSYALNFDEGHNGDLEDESPDEFPKFSDRYATAPLYKPASTDSEQNVVVSSRE
ncbi:uncharacterized protein LOC127083605 [Lathyrus oleraceus]|uniref:Uncharacterized protein n=1 Tax=Pisum sativum TaxID=3888 RepID=A0A9D4WR92_PEA|nr:uncharacterized protein LOC127083605 [Pisum sativum]KAI5407036.1 hypothetical protein KIW84_053336 [Pisum sativum]